MIAPELAPVDGSSRPSGDECPFTLKERGNSKVGSSEWKGAIEDYSAAVSTLQNGDGSKEGKDLLATVWTNRALCHLKRKDYKAAADDCTSALAIDEIRSKALYRRAQAKEGLSDVAGAMSDLKSLLQTEPDNLAAIRLASEMRERHGLGGQGPAVSTGIAHGAAHSATAVTPCQADGQPRLRDLRPAQLAELQERGLLSIYEDDPDFDEIVMGVAPGTAAGAVRDSDDFRPWEGKVGGASGEDASDTTDLLGPPQPPSVSSEASTDDVVAEGAAAPVAPPINLWQVTSDFIPPPVRGAGCLTAAAGVGTAKSAKVLRNFTLRQLAEHDGSDPAKPIYISLCQQVHDVTMGRSFYGRGQAYSLFAGHDVSKALARMSFDLKNVDDFDMDDLAPTERQALNGWAESYTTKYPIVGRLVVDPPQDLKLTRLQLSEYDGAAAALEGYATPSIYVAVRGTVFDVSFGGTAHFGPGHPYACLAGKDASLALAKMSLLPEDVDASAAGIDLSTLPVADAARLRQWHARFKRFKRYPAVGKLID